MTTYLTNQLSFLGQLLLLFNLPMILIGGYTFSWTAILLLIIAPSINILLQFSLSRTREYRADLGAAELLGDPEPLASALAKIDRYQRRYLHWFFPPGYKPEPQGGLFQTHPSTRKRIQKLLEIDDHKSTTAPIDMTHTYPVKRFEKRARLGNPLLHVWNS
jgi:heat shock protein HtpX